MNEIQNRLIPAYKMQAIRCTILVFHGGLMHTQFHIPLKISTYYKIEGLNINGAQHSDSSYLDLDLDWDRVARNFCDFYPCLIFIHRFSASARIQEGHSLKRREAKTRKKRPESHTYNRV